MDFLCICTIYDWFLDRESWKDFIVPTLAIFGAIWGAYGAAKYQLQIQKKIEKERVEQKKGNLREIVLIALKKERDNLNGIREELFDTSTVPVVNIPDLKKWILEPSYYRTILNIELTSLLNALDEPLKNAENINDAVTFICVINDLCGYMSQINGFQDSFYIEYKTRIASLNMEEIELLRLLRSTLDSPTAAHFRELKFASDKFEAEINAFEISSSDPPTRIASGTSNIYIFKNLAQSVISVLSTDLDRYPDMFRVSQKVLWLIHEIEFHVNRLREYMSKHCELLYQRLFDTEEVIQILENWKRYSEKH